MAARRKKSADERRLATLREIANEGANRNCLECHQRGPTYVDMTIASFVCTKCCGLLRGLNPPHRTKSITMTSFTDEEIDFVRNRGNEFNRYNYLGTYDERSNLEKESLREEHKIRDFLVQKYERKRWYVDPEIAQHKMQLDRRQKAAAEQGVSLTGGSVSMPSKPPATFATRSQPVTPAGGELWSPPLHQGPTSNSFSNDLFALCKEPIPPPADPFKSSQPAACPKSFFDPFQTTGGVPTTVISPPPNVQLKSGDFADFDSAFGGPAPPPPPPPAPPAAGAPMLQPTESKREESRTSQAPQADRYAALAELDELFSGQKSDASTKFADCSHPVSRDPWAGQQASAALPSSNPFSPTGAAPATSAVTTNPWGAPAVPQSATSPNPFASKTWGGSSPQGRTSPTAISGLAGLQLNGQAPAWTNGCVQPPRRGLFQNTQSQLQSAFPASWAPPLAQNGVKRQPDSWAVFGQSPQWPSESTIGTPATTSNGWASTNGANSLVGAWPQQIPNSASTPFIAARSASPAAHANKVLPHSLSMQSPFATANGASGVSNGSSYSNPFAANGAGGVPSVARLCSTSNPFL